MFLPNMCPTPCPTGHSFTDAKKPLCSQVTLHHFQYLDYHTSISFPKVVLLSPAADLSVWISKLVPMDLYPFPGDGLLMN